jgi:hypothetical protein
MCFIEKVLVFVGKNKPMHLAIISQLDSFNMELFWTFVEICIPCTPSRQKKVVNPKRNRPLAAFKGILKPPHPHKEAKIIHLYRGRGFCKAGLFC